MIKLVVSDIDGCISSGKGDALNLNALEIIQNFNDESKNKRCIPPITLCSGRSVPYVEVMMQAIKAYYPAIIENGVGIYFPRTGECRVHPLISSKISEIQEVIIQAKQLIFNEIIRDSTARFEWGKEFSISINPPSNMKSETLFDNVRKTLSDFDNTLTISHSASAVDITPKGIDKWSGLQFLSDQISLNCTDIAGIGDSQGDLSLLKNVGLSAAPKNATPVVKHYVDYLSEYEDVTGVCDIIKHCITLNQSRKLDD